MLFRGAPPAITPGSGIRGAVAPLACALMAASAGAATLEDVRACFEANVPGQPSALTVQLDSRHRDAFESRHQGRIYWRRSPEGREETLICMTDPPEVRGLAYLVLEGDADATVWGYLPEKEKVVQIHASVAARRARIARTAISYDDLRYLPMNLGGARPERIRSSAVAGRRVAEVDLALPKGDESLYARVVAYLDEATCVPLKTELYETPEKLLKVVTVDPATITETSGVRLARSMRVEDLKNQVTTVLRIQEVLVGADLPERMFAPAQLKRNRCRSLESLAGASASD